MGSVGCRLPFVPGIAWYVFEIKRADDRDLLVSEDLVSVVVENFPHVFVVFKEIAIIVIAPAVTKRIGVIAKDRDAVRMLFLEGFLHGCRDIQFCGNEALKLRKGIRCGNIADGSPADIEIADRWAILQRRNICQR